MKSYFLSYSDSDARFKRLNLHFQESMTEVHLLFYQSVMPAFTESNKLLQSESPLIHRLQICLLRQLKTFLNKFLKPNIIAECDDLSIKEQLPYKDTECQLSDEELFIGFLTKMKLGDLLTKADISQAQVDKFHDAVRAFYVTAVDYMYKWFPLQDPLLINSKWTIFYQRLETRFSTVEYFLDRYSNLLKFSPDQMNRLNEQFCDYQTMALTEIPKDILEYRLPDLQGQKKGDDNEPLDWRVDHIWSYMSTLKDDTSKPRFDLLFQVARVILVIPHLNAGEERIFSLINKNKTEYRPNLKLDTTLASLITIKVYLPESVTPCYRFVPSADLLAKAKKATKLYNLEHSTSGSKK